MVAGPGEVRRVLGILGLDTVLAIYPRLDIALLTSDHDCSSDPRGSLPVIAGSRSRAPRWQRGSNENINGLPRQYFPTGTDLSVYTAAQLQAIEDELNDRPRKRFGYHTPREQLATLLADNQRVATTP